MNTQPVNWKFCIVHLGVKVRSLDITHDKLYHSWILVVILKEDFLWLDMTTLWSVTLHVIFVWFESHGFKTVLSWMTLHHQFSILINAIHEGRFYFRQYPYAKNVFTNFRTLLLLPMNRSRNFQQYFIWSLSSNERRLLLIGDVQICLQLFQFEWYTKFIHREMIFFKSSSIYVMYRNVVRSGDACFVRYQRHDRDSSKTE